MKVILVSPYSDHLVGGIINWTKYILNYQRGHCDDVKIFLLNNENAVQVMADATSFSRLYFGIRNYLPICRQFSKKVTEERFDVAHICTSASFGLIRDLLIVREARTQGIKTTVHFHFGRIPQILENSGWEKWLLKQLLKRTDRVIVMDKASLNALQFAGYNNVSYLPNPLAPEVQRDIEKTGILQRESRMVVYAGHITESKGVVELVRACRCIQNVKLKLLGKVTTEEIRSRLMIEGGKESEKWLSIPGNMPIEDVIKEMMACTVFVLPSHSEGFPNVILESMACGCPIVATSVGAIPEMLDVDGDNPCGICVPLKDVDELRFAIQKLIDAPSLGEKMGEKAKKRVMEEYSMPKIWKQLVGIWNSL